MRKVLPMTGFSHRAGRQQGLSTGRGPSQGSRASYRHQDWTYSQPQRTTSPPPEGNSEAEFPPPTPEDDPLSVSPHGIYFPSDIPLAGRITHFFHVWQLILSDQWGLQTVRGYSLEFFSPPIQLTQPLPTRTDREYLSLIDLVLQELLQKGAIERARGSPVFVSRIFLVRKKVREFCPVINVKTLNTFIGNRHFKM